jgi:hypothetical protein
MSQSIAKTMLIVKSDANALKGVEQFLKNRDWNLISTHDMKKAIVSLVQLKPSFVLITVDHPSKKMAKFPKIVMSAFPTCVMMFAEKSTTSSFKTLLDSGIEYRIKPPLTGPAIERAVNKYLRDLENAEKQKGQATNEAKEQGKYDFNVQVKSGGQKESGFVSVSAQSKEGEGAENSIAQSLLAQLSGDDSDDEVESNEMYRPDHSSDAKKSGIIYSQSEKKDAKNSIQENESSLGHVIPLNQPGPSTDSEDSLMVPIGSMQTKKSSPSDSDQGSPVQPGKDIMIGRARSKGGAGIMPGENVTSDLELPDYDPQKATGGLILNQNEKAKGGVPRLPQEKTHLRQGGIFTEESVFVKGVNKTLDETVVKGSGEIQSHLEDNSHLACIVVESPWFSGYLVAALGKDKRIDHDFVNLVRTRLMKFLIDNGEPIEDESNMQVKVKRVDFEGWALEYAQFLRKSVHKGDEVAMAFFPFAEAQTKVGVSAKENMVSVKTTEIESGKPLEFNMYIYLPTNKKYILYTPQGSVLQENQKDRLVRQGVDNVHIQKDDIQNFSKFKAQNHLNSLIDQFEVKKQNKAPKKKAV